MASSRVSQRSVAIEGFGGDDEVEFRMTSLNDGIRLFGPPIPVRREGPFVWQGRRFQQLDEFVEDSLKGQFDGIDYGVRTAFTGDGPNDFYDSLVITRKGKVCLMSVPVRHWKTGTYICLDVVEAQAKILADRHRPSVDSVVAAHLYYKARKPSN